MQDVEDRRIRQEQSIFGGEAKSLPYLLAQMNLVLHGLESAKIDPLNSLRFPLREIGDRDRVDVIIDQPALRRGICGRILKMQCLAFLGEPFKAR